MATELETSLNATTSYNKDWNTGSALKIRLETKQILEQIELFLRGHKIVVIEDKGKIKTTRVAMGTAKANDEGIQTLLNWLQMVLNPQTVQGNFPADGPAHSTMYEIYVYHFRIDLATAIITNCYNWEIEETDIHVITDSIMSLIEPFMTRLIDNKERESYDNTIKHLESHMQTEKPGGFKFFGGNS